MLTIDAETVKPKYIYLIKVKSTLIQALESPNKSNPVVPHKSKSVLANNIILYQILCNMFQKNRIYLCW